MKSLNVHARLHLPDGNPVANMAVSVQVFDLKSNDWKTLGETKTTRAGNLSLTINMATKDVFAPMVRLLNLSEKTSSVLGQTAHLQYQPDKDLLLLDFGILTLAAEKPAMLIATQATFNKSPLVFTALPESELTQSLVTAAVKKNVINSESSSEVTQLRQEKLTLEKELQSKSIELDTLKLQIPSGRVSQTGENIKTEIPPLSISKESLVATTNNPLTIDTFQAEIIRFQAKEATLLSDLLKKDQDLSVKSSQLVALQKETALIEANLRQLETINADLIKQNDTLTKEAKKASPLTTIAANIGSQINAANTKLINEKQAYQIQNIQVELRGTLSQEGQAINLANPIDSAHAVASSLVRLDLIPQANIPDSSQLKVPDLSGLTETAVQRLLKSLGLQLKPIAFSVPDTSEFVIGQAIRQSPAAGTAVSHQETILVVFATRLEEST